MNSRTMTASVVSRVAGGSHTATTREYRALPQFELRQESGEPLKSAAMRPCSISCRNHYRFVSESCQEPSGTR